MAELTNYVLQQRPIRSIDLGVVNNTFSTITAGNKEALQKTSELRTAIANMDLNEAEDGFREQLYNDITKTIEDNSVEGNAYYALDDIIKKTGDIGSNPALLGRLRAQQAYKTYKAQIDSRTDIDQDTKDWAKELNPYNYQDKIDENGKIIGGTEWIPNFTPTSTLDMNKIYQIASSYIVPKKGSINTTTFLNQDGSMSTTYDPNKNPVILNTTTGTTTVVTPEMIRNAIDMAINANPEYDAQMKQAFEVAKWKYSKEPNVPNLAYDNNRQLSFDEYKNNLISPFINSQIRNERIAHTTWQNASSKISNGSGSSGSNNKGTDLFNSINDLNSDELFNFVGNARSAKGYSINLPTRYLEPSIAGVWQNAASIASKLNVPITEIPETYDGFIAAAKGKPQFNLHMPTADDAINANFANRFSEEEQKFLGINPNLSEIRLDTTQSIYPNAINLNDKEQQSIKDFYDVYGTELSSLKHPDNFNDEQVIDYVESVIRTSSGLDVLNNNDSRFKPYLSAYHEAINKLFDGDDSATYTLNAGNNISTTDKTKLSALGINVIGNSITITKDNPDAVYAFYDYIINHIDGKFSPTQKYTDRKRLNTIAAISSGGRFIPGMINHDTIDEALHRDEYTSRIGPITDFFKSLNADRQNILVDATKNGTVYDEPTTLLSTSTLGGYSITDLVGNIILELTGDSKVKTMTQTASDNILDLAKSSGFLDCDVFIATKDENGDMIYKTATRPEKEQIRNELSAINNNSIIGNLSYINGFEFRPGLTYSRTNYIENVNQNGKTQYTKNPNSETISIIIGDGLNDPNLEKLNANDYLQVGKQLTYNWLTNTPITIGQLGSQKITISGIKPGSENNIYNGTFNVYMGNDIYKQIDAPTAIKATIAYRMMIDNRKNIKFTEDEETNSELLGEYFSQNPSIFNTLVTLYGYETAIDVAYDIFKN